MLEDSSTVLRPARQDDMPLLGSLRNDPELQALLLAVPRPSPAWRVQEWVSQRSADHEGAFFVVAERDTDQPLGFVQMTNAHPVHRVADLGICLIPEARDKRHAS